jgi:hypothetical protein
MSMILPARFSRMYGSTSCVSRASAKHIDLELVTGFVQRNLFHWPVQTKASVVDQDIDPAVVPLDLLDRGDHVLF